MTDPSPAPPRSGWRRVARGALIAWAVMAFVATSWRTADGVLHRSDVPVVVDWRLGEPRSLSLRSFLHTMAVYLPPDQRVAFSSETDDPNQRFFLTRWSAYFLPGQRVVLLPGSVAEPKLAAAQADYVITYNHRLEHPGLEEVARHPSGALYRVMDAGEAGGGSGGETGDGGAP